MEKFESWRQILKIDDDGRRANRRTDVNGRVRITIRLSNDWTLRWNVERSKRSIEIVMHHMKYELKTMK